MKLDFHDHSDFPTIHDKKMYDNEYHGIICFQAHHWVSIYSSYGRQRGVEIVSGGSTNLVDERFLPGGVVIAELISNAVLTFHKGN